MAKTGRIESEKLLEANHHAFVKKVGGLAIKIPGSSFIGFPDKLCLFKGGIAEFVEFKTTGKKPTKIQSHVHKLLRDLGFRVWVIDSTETLNEFKNYERI